ncbi:MAG: hypothetical protein V4613_13250 [Bacteroidota bacterium]
MKILFTIFISAIIYITLSGFNDPPKSKKLIESISKWQSDTNGCKNIRNHQLFNSIFDSIKTKNTSTILEYLGRPDLVIDTFDTQNNYIIYEYYYHSFCSKGKIGSEVSIIKIGFTKSDSAFYRLVIWDH